MPDEDRLAFLFDNEIRSAKMGRGHIVRGIVPAIFPDPGGGGAVLWANGDRILLSDGSGVLLWA